MVNSPTETLQWVLQNRPESFPKLAGPNATFKLVTRPLPILKDSQVLVKTLFLSNDAAQRVWISKQESLPKLYIPPIEIGEAMRATSLGEVIESHSDKVPKGTIVKVFGGWSQYSVHDESKCMVIAQPSSFNLTHHLGALGITGLTAYYGLTEIVKATKDDVIVVSGAAGATGSMAVQIAKKLVRSRKVIGIAGTDQKCRFVEGLGADECLNYKSPTFHEDLIKATEGGVDVFFDNVGGNILDLMFARMNLFGRIALCGAVSRYNSLADQVGFKNFEKAITMRLELRGFVALDYLNHLPKVVQVFTQAVDEGKLQIGDENETVITAKFEDIPRVWVTLYGGNNRGKLVTKLKL